MSPKAKEPSPGSALYRLDEMISNVVDGRDERRQGLSLLLNDPVSSKRIFDDTFKKTGEDLDYIRDTLRDAKDAETLNHFISLFFATANKDWLVVMIEGVNNRITEQNKLISQLINAVKTENETKLTELSEKLAQAPKLTETQSKALDLFKKAMDEMATQDQRGGSIYG